MVTVPAATPVTSPLAAFTVAIEMLELLQVPPGWALSKSVTEFTHTFIVPVIAGSEGKGFTVKFTGPKVAIHPAALVTTTDTCPPEVKAGGQTFEGPFSTSMAP